LDDTANPDLITIGFDYRSYSRVCFGAFHLQYFLEMGRISILGISAYYHDSAAVLLVDGEIIAAAQEERFTRIKNDFGFPVNAVKYVLKESGFEFNDLTAIAFYDKPLLKFERLLETYHSFAPAGLKSFITAMPVWIKEKLFMRNLLRNQLSQFGENKLQVLFPEHHLSHAASAYYPSPYHEAAILTVDGAGEWATATIGEGKLNRIKIHRELHFPHSVGLLYSAFTYYLGFRVNSGEYKLMGLAPYGNPEAVQTKEFREKILSEMVNVREDGSILLNMTYFNFATKLTMTNDRKWKSLLGVPRREPESEINQGHMNLALAIQQITEEIVIALARTARELISCKNLVMAGGVALNCVANSKIKDTGIFENIWVQPAAGDAGGALGAAYAVHHIFLGNSKEKSASFDAMKYSYLGPQFSDIEIERVLNRYEAPFEYIPNPAELTSKVSQKIADGKIVGWFQGRMEFGPRALGNRSILADPRNPEIQKNLNLEIKFREGFRPFAPSVLLEDLPEYFSFNAPSPYMVFTAKLKKGLQYPEPENYAAWGLYNRLYHIRSFVPAVTHVDYSARIQTVSPESNPLYWQLIRDFKKITGCGMIVNTSFNVRGEPMVCTPAEAYRDFMITGMDYLVIGHYMLDKKNQNPLPENERELVPLD
jgi:carbamoyltransferase